MAQGTVVMKKGNNIGESGYGQNQRGDVFPTTSGPMILLKPTHTRSKPSSGAKPEPHVASTKMIKILTDTGVVWRHPSFDEDVNTTTSLNLL
jgi:hypothetical protein